MKITFLPLRCDQALAISRDGEALVLNGERLDFTALGEGAICRPDCPWIASDVCRIDGQIQVSIFLPHSGAASETALYPDAVLIDRDGAIDLPN